MAKKISTSLKFYYDEELFNNRWASELDPTSLALLQSGAMVESSEIAAMISGGGNYYTIPFYKDIEGEELNYDGATDITDDDTEDGKQSGVVYGRAKGWRNTIFINDFTGADPMANILARIQKWRGKKMQARIVKILEAVLSTTKFADAQGANVMKDEWAKHVMDISSEDTNVTQANQIQLTTLRDLAVQALGDNADEFSVAIMHSQVANKLSQYNVLEYFKYNDARGQELDVKVGRNGNMIIFICDEVPTDGDGETKAVAYTTYVLGRGVLLHASAPVEKPSDVAYDPKEKGGVERLYTRYRETVHPNGFSFGMTSLPISPTDEQLGNKENWTLEMNPKNIAIAKLVCNINL